MRSLLYSSSLFQLVMFDVRCISFAFSLLLFFSCIRAVCFFLFSSFVCLFIQLLVRSMSTSCQYAFSCLYNVCVYMLLCQSFFQPGSTCRFWGQPFLNAYFLPPWAHAQYSLFAETPFHYIPFVMYYSALSCTPIQYQDVNVCVHMFPVFTRV